MNAESMTEDLDVLLERVVDPASFLAFVRALIADREDEVAKKKEHSSPPSSNGVNGWAHDTIEGYLDAAVACAEDSGGQLWETSEAPSWKAFAEFLYHGKNYE